MIWAIRLPLSDPLRKLLERLPSTLELVIAASLLSIVAGIPLGVLSAVTQGKPADTGVRSLSVIGVSLPSFWLGLLLQLLFANALGWFPGRGAHQFVAALHQSDHRSRGFFLIDTLASGNSVALGNVISHLVLPAITLAAFPIGLIARMTRATMLEILGQKTIFVPPALTGSTNGASSFAMRSKMPLDPC